MPVDEEPSRFVIHAVDEGPSPSVQAAVESMRRFAEAIRPLVEQVQRYAVTVRRQEQSLDEEIMTGWPTASMRDSMHWSPPLEDGEAVPRWLGR